MNLNEFFAMGGYAFYVWTSYGLAFVVLAFNIVLPSLNRRRALRRIAQRQRVRRARRMA